MMLNNEVKVRENRCRRKAVRCGMRLEKSPRRDPDAIDHGLFALVNGETNGLVNPAMLGQPYSWTLEQVEDYFEPENKNKNKKKKRA